jgi:membrane-bound lytic murein transglycosylase D
MNLRLPARAARLALLASAAILAACAQQPTTRPALPEAVAERAARERPALPLPVERAPLDDELPPVPIVYPDVLDRIRGGFQLADVQHPWVQSEFNWYVRNGEYLNRVFGRAQRYLHHIANEVEARGMPMELALLPLVESAFNPFAYSRAHASGLWQFIPETGKRHGLQQNFWQDQRRDVLESTRAALDYLTFLHNMHGGDWQLAIASYNFGGGNVRRAIVRNQALGRNTDFFSLSMPAETRAYVPKLIALARLVRDPAAYGVTLPYIPDAPYFRVVQTGGPVDLRLAASLAGIDVEELHALNAGWNQAVTGPDGPHRLLIPAVVADAFEPRFAALDAAQRANLARYTVASGDTLASLARRHDVPVAFLAAVNNTDGAQLAIGSDLLVPGGRLVPLRADLDRSASTVHVVRAGDTLWGISQRYGMSLNELTRINNIKTSSTLQPGQRLNVRASGAAGAAPTRSAGSTQQATTRRIAYRVQKGDTLSSIARRFSVSVRDLMAWNGLNGSTVIRSGQSLTLHVDARRDFGG